MQVEVLQLVGADSQQGTEHVVRLGQPPPGTDLAPNQQAALFSVLRLAYAVDSPRVTRAP